MLAQALAVHRVALQVVLQVALQKVKARLTAALTPVKPKNLLFQSQKASP